MESIRICLNGNHVFSCPGETIGIYTVAPSVVDNGNFHYFTAGAYSVRSAESGMTVAAFFAEHIARNFASMLMRRYGDISQSLRNSFNRCETEQDAALLDEIQQLSFHESRVRKGMIVPCVRIPGSRPIPSGEVCTRLNNQRPF